MSDRKRARLDVDGVGSASNIEAKVPRLNPLTSLPYTSK
jgi:hypothetical protein